MYGQLCFLGLSEGLCNCGTNTAPVQTHKTNSTPIVVQTFVAWGCVGGVAMQRKWPHAIAGTTDSLLKRIGSTGRYFGSHWKKGVPPDAPVIPATTCCRAWVSEAGLCINPL